MRNIMRTVAWGTVSLGLVAGLAMAEPPRSIVGRERRSTARSGATARTAAAWAPASAPKSRASKTA